MSVLRVDTGTVRSVQRTPQGGLMVDANITRVGVLPYRDRDGKQWSEFRPPEEVFSAASLASMHNAPVTDQHPPGLVTAENWSEYSKGHVDSNVTQDGEFVSAPMIVQDAAACALIESGERRDVSAGYTCDLDPTPGSYQGQKYDKIQRNIRYNHAAILSPGAGRAGPEVCLRMDGAAISVSRNDASDHGDSMKTIKVFGKLYRTDNEADMAAVERDAGGMEEMGVKKEASHAAALDGVQKALSEAMVLVAQLQAKLQAMENAASVAAPEESAEASIPEEVLDAAIVVREKLRADAVSVLGEKFDCRGKTSAAIRTAVLSKLAPNVKFDALAAPAQETLFAAMVEAFGGKTVKRSDALDALHIGVITMDASEGETSESTSAKLLQDTMNRGRAPLGAR